jgi:small subunit ribosomal protein S21
LQVVVKNNNIDRAIRTLKKKLAEDGLFKALQEKERYEKPSDKRRRKLKSAVVRERKRQAELAGL